MRKFLKLWRGNRELECIVSASIRGVVLKQTIFGVCLGFSLAVAKAGDAPLPDPQVLRQRLIGSAGKQQKDRENYSCTVHHEEYELNSDGSVKKKQTTFQDRFFVNGWGVNHVLERDGKPLTKDEAQKEQERVDKVVKKYSDAKRADKAQQEWERQLDVFLKALRFTNGHREERNGRSLVVYDLSRDPSFHPQKVEERFAQALTGTIWVDEEVGFPQELKLQTDRDVRIAAGVANLHKGFQLHLLWQRQPDGVWLTKVAEGSGDARALFLRQRFRFHEEMDQCHLFSVNTQQKIQEPKNLPR
jgi:hypothetical protein